MTNSIPPIAVTTGEPAGIGPEVSLRACLELDVPVVLIGSAKLLEDTAKRLGMAWPLPERISIRDVPLRSPVEPGKLCVANAEYVLDTLRAGAQGAMEGIYGAVATAPVQKSVIDETGVHFTGHTEFFAEMSRVSRVVMMLVSDTSEKALRVALATTHLPLADIPKTITGELLDEVISILDTDLRKSFGIAEPKIAVTGLNPHAGESGHMGREEIDTIAPAIERAHNEGVSASGPWPADTIFVRTHAEKYDAILCMYHDQGLPALKREGFGHGINITLGLPWVRTSVDHGTALDIAGAGKADAGSMIAAVELAHTLAENRRRYNELHQ